MTRKDTHEMQAWSVRMNCGAGEDDEELHPAETRGEAIALVNYRWPRHRGWREAYYAGGRAWVAPLCECPATTPMPHGHEYIVVVPTSVLEAARA